MQLKKKPFFKEFVLETATPTDVEEGKEVKIWVRQANEEDNLMRSQAMSRLAQDRNTRNLYQIYNRPEIFRDEAYAVLMRVENIMFGDEPAFPSGEGIDGERVRYAMSKDQFNERWGMLDPGVAAEIRFCVHDVNTMWSENRRGE